MTAFYLICFDVRDAKRLRKIANEMENFGNRVQRSVFECHLEAAQVLDLQERLENWLDIAEDQVRYYRLCGEDKAQIVVDGPGRVTADPDFHVLLDNGSPGHLHMNMWAGLGRKKQQGFAVIGAVLQNRPYFMDHKQINHLQ